MDHSDRLSADIQAELSQKKSNWEKILLADVLLSREETITGLKIPFEALFNGLNRKQLKDLEASTQICPATMRATVLEIQKRGMQALQWFMHSDAGQEGPWTSLDLEEQFRSGRMGEVLIWREGMKEWDAPDRFAFLSGSYFFDQEIQDVEVNPPVITPATNQSQTQQVNTSKKSNSWIIFGVLQFLAVPFWAILSIFSFIGGFQSVIGPILPLMFSIAMAILSIPLAFGLLKGASWAYQVRLATGVISVLFFATRFFIDEGMALWLVFAIFEALFLTGMIMLQERAKLSPAH